MMKNLRFPDTWTLSSRQQTRDPSPIPGVPPSLPSVPRFVQLRPFFVTYTKVLSKSSMSRYYWLIGVTSLTVDPLVIGELESSDYVFVCQQRNLFRDEMSSNETFP